MSALVDYAWQKPSPAQIVGAGYAGVLRYLSLDASKNLTPLERDGLLAAGLCIGLVWETTATRAGQGYQAGQHDVQAAEAQANALGYPLSCPIFYAVDYAASVSAVLPYFQGVMGLASHPVGVYGSASVCEGVPAPWKWQTTAWSGGRVSPQAHLYQTLDPSLPGCDHNRVLQPVPLWSTSLGPGGIAASVVTIPAAPNFPTNQSPDTPAPTIQEDPMIRFSCEGTVYLASLSSGAFWAVPNSEYDGLLISAPGVVTIGDINARQRDLYRDSCNRAALASNPAAQPVVASVDPAAIAAAVANLPTDTAKAVLAALSQKLGA